MIRKHAVAGVAGAALVAGLVSVVAAPPAVATKDPSPPPPVKVNPLGRKQAEIGVQVRAPGHPGAPGRPESSTRGSSGGGSSVSGSSSGRSPSGRSRGYNKAAAERAFAYHTLMCAGNPGFESANPGRFVEAAMMQATPECRPGSGSGRQGGGHGHALGGGRRAPAPPSSAVLAREAYGELDLPSPTINRSPDEKNSDSAFGGQSYTWVNINTYFWTSQNTWSRRQKTVSAGPVSATVTATPTEFLVDPGNGASRVSCEGPGVPWTKADAHSPPPPDACAYQYRHTTHGDSPLTSTETIQWRVSWRGNDGSSGELPLMQTQASSSYIVEQVETVNTGGR